METLITVIFLILTFLSFIFIFFGGFGNFLIFLFSFLYAVLTGFNIISTKVLIALALVYLTGEIFEYVFIILGARISGAGKKAAFGAIIGGIIGAALSLSFFGAAVFPLTVLGIFLGAFLVELKEKRDFLKALRAGIGSFLGRFGAVFFKMVIGLLMIIIIITHIFAYLN
ncbi:MAG: DUF456 domain-containing protein [Candidatus Saelkia tenebricola]|nr:DUF456 domain-containing protein [Candidatus Saelkia tenebricola]